jgi:hypothetical protein
MRRLQARRFQGKASLYISVRSILLLIALAFEKQNYALALPDESPDVELLTQALLAVCDTIQWKAEIARYIGQ